MCEIFVIGGVRVLVEQDTGRAMLVQDAETGADAALLWSRQQIDSAIAEAHMAWASTIECCA